MKNILKRLAFGNFILKLSLAKQFLLLAIFLSFGIYATNYWVTQETKKVAIHGDLYNEILIQKDLASDVLPPPELLIEAWQVALEMSLSGSNFNQLTDKSSQLRKSFETRYKHWNKVLKTETPESKKLNQVYKSGIEFLDIRDQLLIPAYLSNDKERINTALLKAKLSYQTHRKSVDELVILSNENVTKLETLTATSFKKNVIFSNILLTLFIIFTAFLCWGLVLNIKLQLGGEPSELGSIAKRISEGHLDQSITVNKNDKSSVAYSIKELQKTLNGMVQSIKYVSDQHKLGDVECIVEPDYFKGGYADIANGINAMMNIHIFNTEKAIAVVKKFGDGNFEAPLELFPGKLAYINHTIEQVRSNLKNLIVDTNTLSQAALEGNLSIRAEANNHLGDFRKIIVGINETLDAVITPLNLAADCIDNIAKGNIPAKITTQYNGDFNKLIENLNLCIDAINAMIADEAMLADAAKQGNLSTRADVNKHQGDFRRIVEGVNLTLDAVIEPFIMTTQYIDLIAHGNVPAKIEGVYHGDFNSLKNDLNTCIDAINNLVIDANMLAEAAKDGAITVRANTAIHEGDFRKVVDGINQTLDLIVSPIKIVKEAVETINTAAGEISSGNSDLSRRTEEQSKSLEKTASSMDALSTRVKQNSENAKQANQLAGEASLVAVQGGKAVGAVVKTMGEINKSASKIEDIISVIDGIAFQTNILALNAAVEAARAGEQGRGFAVVAGEVRNLAKRSADAAKEIKELIKESVTKTAEGTIQVESAGKTMQEIVTSVERVTNIMGEILTASVEQSSGIDDVNKAIASMDEVTQQNAALVEEAAAAAESLIDLADALVNSVSNFKTNQEVDSKHYAQTSTTKNMIDFPKNADYKSNVTTRTGTDDFENSNVDFF